MPPCEYLHSPNVVGGVLGLSGDATVEFTLGTLRTQQPRDPRIWPGMLANGGASFATTSTGEVKRPSNRSRRVSHFKRCRVRGGLFLPQATGSMERRAPARALVCYLPLRLCCRASGVFPSWSKCRKGGGSGGWAKRCTQFLRRLSPGASP